MLNANFRVTRSSDFSAAGVTWEYRRSFTAETLSASGTLTEAANIEVLVGWVGNNAQFTYEYTEDGPTTQTPTTRPPTQPPTTRPPTTKPPPTTQPPTTQPNATRVATNRPPTTQPPTTKPPPTQPTTTRPPATKSPPGSPPPSPSCPGMYTTAGAHHTLHTPTAAAATLTTEQTTCTTALSPPLQINVRTSSVSVVDFPQVHVHLRILSITSSVTAAVHAPPPVRSPHLTAS